jgi:endoglucanase
MYRLLVLVAFLALTARDLPAAEDAFAMNRQLGRGVNIIGYDPLWKSRDQARFQEKHFRLLHEAGFQTVRINLHPFRHMAKEAPYQLPETWWQTLEWAVTNATRNHLNVLLDFHEYNPMGQDPQGNRERFLAFWREASARYARAPQNVLFEILNEPCKKLTPELWNEYLREALAIIREKNPDRFVVIGPAFWNSIKQLDSLKLPEDDRRIIVTVHYYLPMAFTHQGAPWSDPPHPLGVSWGSPEDLQELETNLSNVAQWSKKANRPIFLGEFGAYDKGPLESRVRYTSAVARQAEKLGFSWAYWQFDSDFILYNIPADAWNEPIRNALVGVK